MHPHILRALVASMGVVVIAPAIIVADPVDVAAVDRVQMPFKKRLKQQNPIWIKYHLKFTESARWQEAKRYSQRNQNNIFWECDAEYARKGLKYRSWAVFQARPEFPSGHQSFVIYNGELQVARTSPPNVYTVSTSQDLKHVIQSPFQLCGDDEWSAIFDSWDKDRSRFVSASSEIDTRNPGQWIRLDLRFSTKWRSRGTFLVDASNAIANNESFNNLGRLQWKSEMSYAEHDGVVYPSKGTYVHYMGDGSDGYSVEYEVTFVETDASRISNDLFTCVIPKDAIVADADRGVRLRNADLAESSIADAIARLERPPGRWRLWLSAGTIIIGFVLALLVLREWLRTRRWWRRAGP